MIDDSCHRQEQLRIQAIGAAISRRNWNELEQAYNAIRDEFDRRPARRDSPDAEMVALADLITGWGLVFGNKQTPMPVKVQLSKSHREMIVKALRLAAAPPTERAAPVEVGGAPMTSITEASDVAEIVRELRDNSCWVNPEARMPTLNAPNPGYDLSEKAADALEKLSADVAEADEYISDIEAKLEKLSAKKAEVEAQAWKYLQEVGIQARRAESAERHSASIIERCAKDLKCWKDGVLEPCSIEEFVQSLYRHAGWANEQFGTRSDPAANIGGMLIAAATAIRSLLPHRRRNDTTKPLRRPTPAEGLSP